MKESIHPAYKIVDVTCACGAKFRIGTTKNVDTLKVEICSQCHPYYTGKVKATAGGGRIERFNKKFGGEGLK